VLVLLLSSGLKLPPVTVMSPLTKSVLASLRVKVTVAVSVVPMLALSISTLMVGGAVSTLTLKGAVVPPDGVLAV
jgi:hypothetical protein